MEHKKNISNIKRLTQNMGYDDAFKFYDSLLNNTEDKTSNQQVSNTSKDINLIPLQLNKNMDNKIFIEKISRLNKHFYKYSDKYIKLKQVLENLNDNLYLNLFQQINCYVEEIERLNKKISVNNYQDQKILIDKLTKELNDNKNQIRHYENKIKEKNLYEEKLLKDIENYKRRNIFYKNKIKIGLLPRNQNKIEDMENAYKTKYKTSAYPKTDTKSKNINYQKNKEILITEYDLEGKKNIGKNSIINGDNIQMEIKNKKKNERLSNNLIKLEDNFQNTISGGLRLASKDIKNNSEFNESNKGIFNMDKNDSYNSNNHIKSKILNKQTKSKILSNNKINEYIYRDKNIIANKKTKSTLLDNYTHLTKINNSFDKGYYETQPDVKFSKHLESKYISGKKKSTLNDKLPSKSMTKKLNKTRYLVKDKDKNKNNLMISILKEINNDYSQSIEMLNAQEEQINNLLKSLS